MSSAACLRVAPAEYRFSVTVPVAHNLNARLWREYSDRIGHVLDHGARYALPRSGALKLGDVSLYVVNQAKQGNLYYWFHDAGQYTALLSALDAAEARCRAAVPTPMYTYNASSAAWNLSSKGYKAAGAEVFVGLDAMVETISADIRNQAEHAQALRELGEGGKSLNYLLYGPPGTGKTSLIRTLASLHSCAVFLISTAPPAVTRELLSPSPATGSPPKPKFVVFEDFDRFLVGKQEERRANPQQQLSVIPRLLNSLDGIDDDDGDGGLVVRFFTGNDCRVIMETPALMNRMAACFRFGMPTRAMFAAKLAHLLTGRAHSAEARERLLDLVADTSAAGGGGEKGISMRPFVRFAVRYLFAPDPTAAMLAASNELLGASNELLGASHESS